MLGQHSSARLALVKLQSMATSPASSRLLILMELKSKEIGWWHCTNLSDQLHAESPATQRLPPCGKAHQQLPPPRNPLRVSWLLAWLLLACLKYWKVILCIVYDLSLLCMPFEEMLDAQITCPGQNATDSNIKTESSQTETVWDAQLAAPLQFPPLIRHWVRFLWGRTLPCLKLGHVYLRFHQCFTLSNFSKKNTTAWINGKCIETSTSLPNSAAVSAPLCSRA